MDVLIFSGQSNMQGSTGSFPEEPAVAHALEYKFLTDELTALCHPVGEFIGDGLLKGAALGNGSLVPYFCARYTERTGREAVAIHVAKGNTEIAEWMRGTPRFDAMIEKVRAGLAKVRASYPVDRVFFIWLQGESDALEQTGTEKYLERLTEFKNDVKRQIPIEKFFLIKVGHFSEFADWNPHPVKEKRKNDREIMRAQELAPKRDPDFHILTRVCTRLSLKKKYLNDKEFGPHYNNAGMKIVGTRAADGLVKYLKGEKV